MAELQLAIDARGMVSGSKQAVDAVNRIIRTTDRGQGRLNRFTGSLNKVKAASVGAATALKRFVGVAAGVIAIRTASRALAGFEKTMAEVGGVSGATRTELEAFIETARNLGATTRFTAQEAGEGLLFLARAGFDANESIAALPSTLDLASAGMLDLGTAADIASNVLSQFGLEAEEMTRVSDTLVNTANSSNTSVQQLSEALKLAGPVAGALGISLEETSAAIGALGDSGIQASLAGTNLRGVMAALADPSDKAAAALMRLGVGLDEIDPTKRNLISIFRRLRRAQREVGDSAEFAGAAFEIFGRRNASAAVILTESIDKVEELTAANENAGGEAAKLARLVEDTLSGAWATLKSAVQEAIFVLGDAGLLDVFRDVVDAMTIVIREIAGVRTELDTASDRARTFASIITGDFGKFVAITGIVLALKSAVVALTVAIVASRAAALAHPFVTLAYIASLAAIATTVDFLRETFEKVDKALKDSGEQAATFGEKVSAVWKVLADRTTSIFDLITTTVTVSFEAIVDSVSTAFEFLFRLFDRWKEGFFTIVDGIGASIDIIRLKTKSLFTDLNQEELDGLAEAADQYEAAINVIKNQISGDNIIAQVQLEFKDRAPNEQLIRLTNEWEEAIKARKDAFAKPFSEAVLEAIRAARRSRATQEAREFGEQIGEAISKAFKPVFADPGGALVSELDRIGSAITEFDSRARGALLPTLNAFGAAFPGVAGGVSTFAAALGTASTAAADARRAQATANRVNSDAGKIITNLEGKIQILESTLGLTNDERKLELQLMALRKAAAGSELVDVEKLIAEIDKLDEKLRGLEGADAAIRNLVEAENEIQFELMIQGLPEAQQEIERFKRQLGLTQEVLDSLPADKVAAIEARANAAGISMQQLEGGTKKTTDEITNLEDSAGQMGNALASALTGAIRDGEEANNVLQQLEDTLIRIASTKFIEEPLGAAFGGGLKALTGADDPFADLKDIFGIGSTGVDAAVDLAGGGAEVAADVSAEALGAGIGAPGSLFDPAVQAGIGAGSRFGLGGGSILGDADDQFYGASQKLASDFGGDALPGAGEIGDLLTEGVTEAGEAIPDIFGAGLEGVDLAAGLATDAVAGVGTEVAGAAAGVATGGVATVGAEVAGAALGGGVDAGAEAAGSAAVVAAVGLAAATIVTGVSTGILAAVTPVTTAILSQTGLQVPLLTQIAGATTAEAANIFTASGGIFRSPQRRIIGEAGPEAVVPLTETAGGDIGIGIGGGIDSGSRRAVQMNVVTRDASSFRRSARQINGDMSRAVRRT